MGVPHMNGDAGCRLPDLPGRAGTDRRRPRGRPTGTPHHLKVIIAGAGMAAALPGVVAASTTLPVIGVPIKGMLDGLDAMLSIIQMPPGIPVATVGVNASLNAAILAAEIIALSDKNVAEKVKAHKAGLGEKIEKANSNLQQLKYEFKTNN